LNGAYAYDDEGVASERVVLVERGVLKSFLMGRRPVKGFDGSNGHGRAQSIQQPVARMGNLIVEASESVTDEELKRRLLAEVRRQKRPFGIMVHDLWGGSTNTSSYGYQAFKGEARLVTKVDADTGKETLVRGVDVVGTPLTSLGQIMAVGRTLDVFNGYCGAESGMVPVSSVAPPVLIRSLELQRSTTERSRAPILDAPTRARTRSK
jgi:predicted Zn-dependent protease